MENTPIQWHPAFIAAINLELNKSRDSLKFGREHNLNVKPLEIDLLITKQPSDRPIDNEIGHLFKGHNILEYKDPQAHLNVDVFFKVEGYACLYKSYGETVDAIKEEDVTITLIRNAKPAGLFRYFTEHGYEIFNPYSGIYYIKGRIPFPVQVIVSKELDPKRHVWLCALSGNLNKQDLQELLNKINGLDQKMDREYAEAVLEVAFQANVKIIEEFMGDGLMSEKLLEIVKPIIEPRILVMKQEALREGIERGIEQGIERGIRGTVDILRNLGQKDPDIKNIITKQYNLSNEEADSFL